MLHELDRLQELGYLAGYEESPTTAKTLNNQLFQNFAEIAQSKRRQKIWGVASFGSLAFSQALLVSSIYSKFVALITTTSIDYTLFVIMAAHNSEDYFLIQNLIHDYMHSLDKGDGEGFAR